MRPLLARFSEPVWSGHLPSWADFITITPELKFSVHTGLELIIAIENVLGFWQLVGIRPSDSRSSFVIPLGEGPTLFDALARPSGSPGTAHFNNSV
jgi:hypothetical protein